MANVISVVIGSQILTSRTHQNFTFQIRWALGQRTSCTLMIFDADGTLTDPQINETVRIVRFSVDIWRGTVDQIKRTFPGGGVRFLELTCNGYERALDKRILVNDNYSMVPCVPDAGADSFQIQASTNPFIVDDVVQFQSADTLAAPLDAGTNYYVVARTSTHIQVSTTQGGAAVNLTDIGVGRHHCMYSAGTIVKRIGFPSSEGIQEGLIRNGVGIQSFVAEYSAVWDLISQLADASGYVAYIEPSTASQPGPPLLYFVPRGEFSAPFAITEASPANVLMDPGISFQETREVYANRVYLLPSEKIFPVSSQNLTGDGAKRIYQVTFPVKDIVAITRAGSVQTVGILGQTGQQWYVQPGSPFIYHDAGETVLGSGEVAVIQYLGVGTNATMAEDATEQGTYGLFESVVSAESVASSADATTTAEARLTAAKVFGMIAEYSTNSAGLRPGQIQQITWPSAGIGSATDFLIDQVTGRWVNGDLRYEVVAQAGTRIPGYAEVFRSFIGGTSSAGAVGGIGGSSGGGSAGISTSYYTITADTELNDAVGSEGSMLWMVITMDITGHAVTFGANFATPHPDVRVGPNEVSRLLFVVEDDGLWHLASGAY